MQNPYGLWPIQTNKNFLRKFDFSRSNSILLTKADFSRLNSIIFKQLTSAELNFFFDLFQGGREG